jgi:site-specific DNA-methyltransferase (adenine-specific)
MSLPKPYYDDGRGIVIYHGDCLKILPLLPDKSIDLIVTDPPYGHGNNDDDLIANREAALGKSAKGAPRPIAGDKADANDLVRFLFRQAKRLLDKGCCCCCCGGGGPDPQFARWSLWMDEILGFKMCVVWDKGGLGMGWHYRRNWECVLVSQTVKWNGGLVTPNVIRFPKIIPKATQHPTEKPPELKAFFIRLHSNPSELVLDPFMGSGSTLVAAKQLGRKAIGIEIEEKYCAMAAERLRRSASPLNLAKPSAGRVRKSWRPKLL